MKKINCNSLLLLFKIIFFCSTATAQEQINVNNGDSIPTDKSSVQLDISFSSRALSAGRDFGVNQYSLMPSISYYHKSGLHAGIAANLLSDAEPKYNLTTAAIGFSDTITAKWSYDIYYVRNFFNPDTAGLIQNSANVSISFLPEYFNSFLQYSYLFGDEKAHRIIAAGNAYLSKDCRRVIDNISFTPGAAFTFGTANVPFNTFTSAQFKTGSGLSWQQWKAQRLSRRFGLTTGKENLKFGLMNIDLSVPVSISIKNFQIGLNYTYAIPQSLSEETGSQIQSTGYFGISLGYIIK
jgi:hypothetical protein